MLDHSQPGPCLTARRALRSRPCDAIDDLRKACPGVSAERAQHERMGATLLPPPRNRYAAWTSRPEPARRAAEHSVLLALLLTATGSQRRPAARARGSLPYRRSRCASAWSTSFGEAGLPAREKSAERRHTASAGFAIDSTRGMSEPGGSRASQCLSYPEHGTSAVACHEIPSSTDARAQ